MTQTSPRPATSPADAVHEAFNAQLRELRRLLQAWGAHGHPYAGAIDIPQADALDVLVERGPCSVGALSDALRVDNSNGTRIVGSLARRGLVTKQRSAADARVVTVVLTPEGEALHDVLRDRRRVMMTTLLADFGPDEVDRFTSLITRFVGAMDDVGPEALHRI